MEIYMLFRIAADILVILHFIFILFVLFGGFLVLRRRWIMYLHIPAVIWGALVEIKGWICPLTPWEQYFRQISGEEGYTGGFIEHYLLHIIYPAGITREIEILLGIFVIVLNLGIYSFVVVKSLHKNR
ncbi:DUF2784 domain-containing protein [Nitrosophilus alvini]|uniref:DUF2784 domain-containing protein n=1 Tax=Nitrosophilus alvini TaxID=2714855 RepID=UPI001F15B29B|nr:DUF2784 domain-containing protein [Nitrosophilus alvini]